MLRKKMAYVLVMFGCGILLASCSVHKSLTDEHTCTTKKNSKSRIKPKIILLRPAECPWNQTCDIRNALKRKEYGSSYAKKQNKRLEDAL